MQDEQRVIADILSRYDGLTDEELDQELESEEARYWEHVRQRELALEPPPEESLTYFNAFAKAVAEECGLPELPHSSNVGHSAFKGEGRLAQAARLTVRAREIAEGALATLPAAVRAEAWEAVSAAATAGYMLALHRAEPWLEENRKLAEERAELTRRARAALKERTEQASQARLRTDWREAAQRVWDAHPTWTKHAVAKNLKESGVAASAEVRSISRAIGDIAPATSPSFKEP